MRGGEERLSALLDGELPARQARRLERDPEVRAELERLARVGAWVREAGTGAGDAPDLWPAVAARLPSLDVELAERREAGTRVRRPLRWLGPALAGAAAAGAAAVLLWVEGPAPGPATPPAAVAGGDVVQWLDTRGRPVMVMEEPDRATVIWVLGSGRDDLSGWRVGHAT